jgi:hypothetical protein
MNQMTATPSSDGLKVAVAAASSQPDAELYDEILRATGEDDVALYSVEARIARAKQIVRSILIRSREEVCKAYRRAREDTPELLEITVVVASALTAAGSLGTLPVAPLAVIAVRHVLDSFCAEPE